jgi:thymidylate synthase ThyX
MDLTKEDSTVNKITENTICYDDLMDYWYYNSVESDTAIYQDYENDKELTLNKDQEYLIQKYIGERQTRRDKLGRAFEFIDYSFELSTSFRIMREFKRHRLTSSIYPAVVTARNSYDSFIFPIEIIQNKRLFDAYKKLIDKSFELYQKIVNKAGYVTAQYVLPLSTRCNYISKINARELDYIFGLRTTPQTHDEFRCLCQGMFTLVKTVHPNISKLLSFTDMNTYNLGRIKSEYRTHQKKSLDIAPR